MLITAFDCLLYEMVSIIRNLKPSLKVQSDSIKTKLFILPCLTHTIVFGFLLSSYWWQHTRAADPIKDGEEE